MNKVLLLEDHTLQLRERAVSARPRIGLLGVALSTRFSSMAMVFLLSVYPMVVDGNIE